MADNYSDKSVQNSSAFLTLSASLTPRSEVMNLVKGVLLKFHFQPGNYITNYGKVSIFKVYLYYQIP